MAIIDPTGLTDQQKSSIAASYKSQGAEAAKKSAEMMRTYNSSKQAQPLSNPNPKASIIAPEKDPLLSGAESSGPQIMNLDVINRERAKSGMGKIGEMYSHSGDRYSAYEGKTTQSFMGQENVPYFGNKPQAGVTEAEQNGFQSEI